MQEKWIKHKTASPIACGARFFILDQSPRFLRPYSEAVFALDTISRRMRKNANGTRTVTTIAKEMLPVF